MSEARREGCRFDHPEKERYLGTQTGDMLCRTCGEAWPKSNPPAEPPCVTGARDER